MGTWNRIYRFEITFENGTLDSHNLPPGGNGRRVDHQRPPASLGVPISVKLIPLVAGYPPVFYPLPRAKGITPVCHLHRTAPLDDPTKITGEWYRVGFAHEGTRSMIAIHIGTGAVSAWFDTNGPHDL